MGTRADFYVGTDERAEWLGSIAWDGYPDSPGISSCLELAPASEEEWRKGVASMLAERGDATTPDMGWPWPWADSCTTDYAYAYDPESGSVGIWSFAHGPWAFDPNDPEGPEDPPLDGRGWPQMDTSRFTLGARSGVVVIAKETNR